MHEVLWPLTSLSKALCRRGAVVVVLALIHTNTCSGLSGGWGTEAEKERKSQRGSREGLQHQLSEAGVPDVPEGRGNGD